MRELIVMMVSAGAVYLTDAKVPDDLRDEYLNIAGVLTLSAGCSKMFGDTGTFQGVSSEFEKFLEMKAKLPDAENIAKDNIARLEAMPLTHFPPAALVFLTEEVCGNIREGLASLSAE